MGVTGGISECQGERFVLIRPEAHANEGLCCLQIAVLKATVDAAVARGVPIHGHNQSGVQVVSLHKTRVKVINHSQCYALKIHSYLEQLSGATSE